MFRTGGWRALAIAALACLWGLTACGGSPAPGRTPAPTGGGSCQGTPGASGARPGQGPSGTPGDGGSPSGTGGPGNPHAPKSAYRYAFPVVGKVGYGRDHHDYPATDIIAACGLTVRAV